MVKPMKRFNVLLGGELQRYNKYNVTAISLLVALIWGGLLYFLEFSLLQTFLPFLLVIDAAMMSVLFVGAVMFFEKSEATSFTLLVTPATIDELIWSKVVANTIHMSISSLLIALTFFLIKDVEFNWLLVIVALLVSTVFHGLLGFVFSYTSKNFTSMLMQVMIYSFLISIPAFLFMFNVIPSDWEWLIRLSPTQSATVLIQAAFLPEFTFDFEYGFALGYLVIGAFLLYRFVIYPHYADYASKESGV